MHDDLLRAVTGLEYQVALLAAAPLATVVVGWTARQVRTHVRDRRAAAYAARLVAWAAQVIPAKSARYGEVAALLSRRFPMLSGEQLEVLIESEVLGLKTALRAALPATAAVGAAVAAATSGDGDTAASAGAATSTAAVAIATVDAGVQPAGAATTEANAPSMGAPSAGLAPAGPSLRIGGA